MSPYSPAPDSGSGLSSGSASTPATDYDEESLLKAKSNGGWRSASGSGGLVSSIRAKLPRHNRIWLLRSAAWRRVYLLCLFIVFFFLFVGHYHEAQHTAHTWIYHNPPEYIDARQIQNILALPQEQFDSLNVDDSQLPAASSVLQNAAGTNGEKVPFDPRLPAALYVHYLTEHIKENAGAIDPSFVVPFAWVDWLDFEKRLKPGAQYLESSGGFPLQNCNEFFIAMGHQNLQGRTCKDLTPAEIKSLPDPLFPRFKITGVFDKSVSQDARVIYGGSYVYHSFPKPNRMIMLDADNDYAVTLKVKTEDKSRDSQLSELAESYLLDVPEAKSTRQINLKAEIAKLNTEFVPKMTNPEISVQTDVSRHVKIPWQSIDQPVSLHESMFHWESDMGKYKGSLDEFTKKVEENCKESDDYSGCNPETALSYGLAKRSQHALSHGGANRGRFEKHFHEAMHTKDGPDNGAHFDWRFYSSRKLSEYESTSALHKLIRSWLRTCRLLGINTWIAHGSLLGYYFNGMMLSWDFDHDVQVTQESLELLARNYHNSIVVDITDGTKNTENIADTGMGDFYIDVGDSYFYRSKGNGKNAIDARFIDIHTGLFVDITALADSKEEPQDLKKMSSSFRIEFKGLKKQYGVDRGDWKQFMEDRNKHYYMLQDFNPMIPTLFEGERTMIPQKFINIISREYMQYKKKWTYVGHTWRTRYMNWISNDICGQIDREGNSCSGNAEVQLDDHYQHKYISKHMVEMEEMEGSKEAVEKAPIDVESWPAVLRPDATLMKIAISRRGN